MNHFKNIGAILILVLLVASCQETPAPSSSNSSTNTLGWTTGGSGTTTTTTGFNDGGTSIDGGSSTDGSTSGGSTTTTSGSNGGGFGAGSTCYGSAADGDNSGMYPIIDYSINLAGRIDWEPTGTATSGQLLIDQYSSAAFTTNYRLRFRVKINPETSSCPYKQSGSQSYGGDYYQKLRYDINFHTLNTDTGELNEPFDTISNQLVDVNGCSQVYTMNQPGIPGDFQNPSTAGPIFVSITNVRSDFECQFYNLENDPGNYYYNFYCPAERLVRSYACWSMKLQVVNDNTDDFQ